MLRKLLVWSLPVFLAIAAAFAQSTDQSKDVRELQKQADRLDKEANQDQGHDAVFESLSKQLNVPVVTLQAEQKDTGFGFGQLFIANSLAAASGKTFDQVAQEFKGGKGWGQIARENNVRLGNVVSDLKRANKQVQVANGSSGRMQATGRPNAAAGKNRQALPKGRRGGITQSGK